MNIDQKKAKELAVIMRKRKIPYALSYSKDSVNLFEDHHILYGAYFYDGRYCLFSDDSYTIRPIYVSRSLKLFAKKIEGVYKRIVAD